MNRDDVCFAPATQLAARIRSKDLSPVEVTAAVVERVESLESQLNAFARFMPERAMQIAEAAEAAVARGHDLGPLHGVPVTIKDLAETAGIPTERGSHIFVGETPTEDTPFVSRLLDSGAIPLGKTTTSEFGWKAVSHSPLTGITSNPWRLGFSAGASSAGAGAGAAAGYGPLHHGSDGAGSVRIPAHCCGVFGMKPTFGRIPNVPVRSSDQVTHHGVITRSVADAAMMLQVMSGPHPLDHYSLEAPPADYLGRCRDGITGLRVAFSPDLGHARVDSEVAQIVECAAGAFNDIAGGVELVEAGFGPQGPELARYFVPSAELELLQYLPDWEDRMDPGLVACIRAAEAQRQEYVPMRARKLRYVEEIHRFFEDWDLLLTPTASVEAFPADQLQPPHWPQHPWDWLGWAEFSYPFNFSGNPAASVPAGFTDHGLPVGLQIVGRRFEDLTVLRAAAAFEKARPWSRFRPQLQPA